MMSEPNEALMADANLVVKKDPLLPAKEFHNGSEFRDLLLEILNKQDDKLGLSWSKLSSSWA